LPIAAPAQDVAIVAVASNFLVTARDLAAEFAAHTGHEVRFTAGSTGKIYAQIVNGAPFDVLLAADVRRPELLEASGDGITGTRFTYAIGELVLWSRTLDDCRAALDDPRGLRIAIANPETAPYGAAARSYLEHAGLWETLRAQLVVGENISQTLQFAASGNAQLGFVAAAQLQSPALPRATCTWSVPADTYPAIEQQAILLRHGAGNPAAIQFLDYLQSNAGRAIIRHHGYRLLALRK